MTTINNVNLGKKDSTLHKLKVYKIDNNARMTTINNVNLGKKDSTLHKLKVYKIDNNAIKTPKYDAFKESMKRKPQAVDLLRDIAGHIIK